MAAGLPQLSQSPPAKPKLKAWLSGLTGAPKIRKDTEAATDIPDVEHVVFGKPLRESLKFASVQISTADKKGELYVWGYIPVVVAKCGLYLKENATEVEGTFRRSGASKRIRDLQAVFETPPRYGKSLDWKKELYTVHDVANVFRRYLTQMPEPVIPHHLYHEFRDTYSKYGSNEKEVIRIYKKLIRSMPSANQYLLLYVLDLLSVFARKSEKNLMNASSLAILFAPGLISHPDHDLSPEEQKLSRTVLEFLIAQQDWFMLDIPPPTHSPQSEVGVKVPDEDIQSIAGGWSLVSKPTVDPEELKENRPSKKMPDYPRSRTTVDIKGATSSRDQGDVSPGAEPLARRKTLPPPNTSQGKSEAGPKVLRKGRRPLSQQPSSKPSI